MIKTIRDWPKNYILKLLSTIEKNRIVILNKEGKEEFVDKHNTNSRVFKIIVNDESLYMDILLYGVFLVLIFIACIVTVDVILNVYPHLRSLNNWKISSQIIKINKLANGIKNFEKNMIPEQCKNWNAVYYMHIPKTGGTSIRYHLAEHGEHYNSFKWCDVPPMQPYGCPGLNNENYKKFLKDKEDTWGETCQAISTHSDQTLPDLFEKKKGMKILYIITIREPIERLISLYFHIKREVPEHKNTSFIQFIRSCGECKNHIIKSLSGAYECYDKMKISKPIADRYIFEEARKTLSKYCIIIPQEHSEIGWEMMRKAFKWPSLLPSRKQKLNSFKHKSLKDLNLTQAEINEVINLNMLDIEFYNHAMNIYKIRKREFGL